MCLRHFLTCLREFDLPFLHFRKMSARVRVFREFHFFLGPVFQGCIDVSKYGHSGKCPTSVRLCYRRRKGRVGPGSY